MNLNYQTKPRGYEEHKTLGRTQLQEGCCSLHAAGQSNRHSQGATGPGSVDRGPATR